ncbi:unnamed protein product [Arctia plantaginis]|uniref:Uncharacterized protein n=1 Tax=Arctia plantaginis TaxID=874455 RepID=A0A8S0YQ91_ARCPL|nr:unnamed protein product [Arctia plantaginis]
MNAREHRQKRKQWKENSKVYRNKKAIAHRNLQRILDDTPPLSPISVVQQIREDVAARNRRQMRKRRAILYAKIVTLEKRMKNAVKLSKKYKKRYLRVKTQKTDPEAPATKVNALLKNVMYEPGHVQKTFMHRLRRRLYPLSFGYFQQHQSNRFTKRRNKSPQKSMKLDIVNDNHQLSLASCSRIQGHTGLFKENDTIDLENVGSTVGSDSDKIATIGDYVLMKWGTAKYPGEVLSVFEDGLMVRCMKQGLKFWRWPNIKDEQLYSWEDVIQKIKTPKLVKRGNYIITELENSTSDVKTE